MQVGRIFPINNPVVDLSLFMTFKRAQLYRSRNTVSIVDAQRQFAGVPELHSRRRMDPGPLRRVEQTLQLLLIRIEGFVQRESQRVAGVIVQRLPHPRELRLAGLVEQPCMMEVSLYYSTSPTLHLHPIAAATAD